MSYHQAPPCRQPAQGARQAPAGPSRPFVPVQLLQPASRRKRPHWAVRAARTVGKALFLCICVFVGFVTFCVAFHHLAPWS